MVWYRCGSPKKSWEPHTPKRGAKRRRPGADPPDFILIGRGEAARSKEGVKGKGGKERRESEAKEEEKSPRKKTKMASLSKKV